MDRKLQRHRADSLRQHGFLVVSAAKQKLSSRTFCEERNGNVTNVLQCSFKGVRLKNRSVAQVVDTEATARRRGERKHVLITPCNHAVSAAVARATRRPAETRECAGINVIRYMNNVT